MQAADDVARKIKPHCLPLKNIHVRKRLDFIKYII
nr:MAG TPA: hypothetical protein [Caudoviricetes sp.]